MKRNATAVWTGDVKTGNGRITSQTGTLKDTQYSFNSRFAEGTGTNPEELLAAAHAGCFAMACSFALGSQGFAVESIDVHAEANMEMQNNMWAVTAMNLVLKGKVAAITQEQFMGIVTAAKENCIISKVLSIPITLDATLV